ncbi:MAG: 4-hydroxythreonine-4-phosphate dehydrogenase PdxA [Candidatus Glassbacteria bacterium]
MGDGRGIGPEVLLKALAGCGPPGRFIPLIVGCKRLVLAQAESLWPRPAGLPAIVREALRKIVDVTGEDELPPEVAGFDRIRDYLLEREALAGRWAGRAVAGAVELVLAGKAEALVTAPLDKHALNLGGYPFPGHTEMLASLAGGVEVAMLLAGGGLRVVPATTHVALARVPELVTRELILGQCRVIDRGLRRVFGIERPRIALCGLNPHLGDGGLAGSEDLQVTAPAAELARREGLDVRGPFPADTVFVRAARGEFDCVLAMYHDQAMVAIKMHAFGKGVNVTLGLPFVRTSPDHGTALDIAGRGVADEGSMLEALALALDCCGARSSGGGI